MATRPSLPRCSHISSAVCGVIGAMARTHMSSARPTTAPLLPPRRRYHFRSFGTSKYASPARLRRSSCSMPLTMEAMRLFIRERSQVSMGSMASLSSIMDSSSTVRMMRSILAT